MVNTATSNEQHHEEQHQHEHLHHPEPLNDPSGILSNSPNFAAVNGIQIFEPIYQPNIAEKHLKVASVTLPNGHKRDFHIHKNSKGNVLFDLAAESETLLEKDYFGLRYEDELGEMTWLYPDKRIQKQLKHKPWNFVFQIKFYPPEPSALADDLTRYLLYLQIRKEIYDGKLPASYAKQILLAAMVMQAEIGDFEAIKQSPHDYEKFLREQHLIPQIDEEVLTKVREAHKEQKGLTPNEAHQKYLDTAKDLAKYGFTFYNAKDTKNGPVILGIYAHGICVYKDQLQIHRFLWQGVNKIQFRGSKFSVVLKPGELDPKKEVTVNYRLVDYATAKKLYRTAVEHHTFFRLIKPEDKPKGTFLRRWGSDRFRYQGRTYFQAKMASQMFDHPSQVVTIQRTPSGRQVSRSVDDLAQPRSFPTSPMHYVDETTQQLTTPEKSKSYSLSTSKADKAKKKAEEKLAKKEKKKDEKRLKKEEKERKKHASKSGAVTAGHVGASSGGYASESSSSSASVSDAEIEERHVVINKAIEGPVQILNRGQELGDLDNIEEEGSAPHTTLHSWHETEDGPETITTEVDEHGNKITRTIKTQTTKHTIQKQTYQTYAVEDADKPDQTIVQTKESTIPLGNQSVTRSPVVHTKTRTVAYEKGSVPHENIDPIGELVSTKTITTGNRTVEILTYKTEKDGVIETRVEHRVTIHSGDNIDHDAELAKALLEATEMSPDLIINRVEVEKQTQR